MDHEGLRVADVGEMRQELHCFDEALACRCTALDAEGQDAARSAWKVTLRESVVPVVLEQRIVDPFDARMLGEMARDRQRRVAMARHAQVQRLDSLQQQEGAERRERS